MMSKNELHLNNLRKPVDKDPQQRWSGTYNNMVLVLTKFFRTEEVPGVRDIHKVGRFVVPVLRPQDQGKTGECY